MRIEVEVLKHFQSVVHGNCEPAQKMTMQKEHAARMAGLGYVKILGAEAMEVKPEPKPELETKPEPKAEPETKPAKKRGRPKANKA